MEGLGTNKILGACLATGLVIAILWIVPRIVFEKTPPAHPGYAIAVLPELSGGPAEAPDVPPDWGTVFPKADVAAGEAKTAVCKSCHMFDPSGTNGLGPGLYGVVGRPIASHPGFAYSPAMQAFAAKEKTWQLDTLYTYLKAPGTVVPGTKMTFVGLKDPQDRINVIAYLHTLGSNLPIPAPKPAAAKAPAAAPAPGGVQGGPPAAKAGQPTAAPAGAPASAKPGTPTPQGPELGKAAPPA